MEYLDGAIKNILQPVLYVENFKKIKEKHFKRERDNFIDEIWFQLSQYGSTSFYIHYSCKFLCTNSDNSDLEIGGRYDDNNRQTTWVSNNDLNARIAILDVLNLIKINILPWFDNIATIKDFLIEDCMINYRVNGGSIMEYFDDEKLLIAKINKKCFYSEALKFESIRTDTIEKLTDKMIKIATSALSDKDMSFKLDEIHKTIENVQRENRNILIDIFEKCSL